MAKTNTTVDDYIKLYGEEVGKEKFEKVLKARARRLASVASGRSNYGKKIAYDQTHIDAGNAVRCQECLAIMPRIQWTHLKKCSSMSLDEYRTKHPNAELVATNLKKKCAVTRENLVELYGDVGVDKFDHYRDKQADSNSFEYKAEKYGMTREEFDEFNASRATTRDNLIARHGEEKGTQMWDNYVERQRYTTSLAYFIERDGEELGKENYQKFCTGRTTFDGVESKMESDLYKELKSVISEVEKHVLLPFAGGAFDMGIRSRKKLIEFYGDYWHANPKKHGPNFTLHTGKVASDIWEKDKAKLNSAASNGYSVMVIWEKDWKENRDAELAKAIAFLS